MSVWLAVSSYAIGVAAMLLARGSRKWLTIARLAWTIGCLAMLVHVACAFHFYHSWSHASALAETARQTAETFGIDWGGGLYFNYAFVAGWTVDVTSWWWLGLDSYHRRFWLLTAIWQAVFAFMIFNATVVFESGAIRWIGAGIFLGLSILCWLRYSKEQPSVG